MVKDNRRATVEDVVQSLRKVGVDDWAAKAITSADRNESGYLEGRINALTVMSGILFRQLVKDPKALRNVAKALEEVANDLDAGGELREKATGMRGVFLDGIRDGLREIAERVKGQESSTSDAPKGAGKTP